MTVIPDWLEVASMSMRLVFDTGDEDEFVGVDEDEDEDAVFIVFVLH